MQKPSQIQTRVEAGDIQKAKWNFYSCISLFFSQRETTSGSEFLVFMDDKMNRQLHKATPYPLRIRAPSIPP